MDSVEPWAWTVLMLAERYRKGLAPSVGGTLDQAHWVTEACEFVDSERQLHLSEYGAMALMYG